MHTPQQPFAPAPDTASRPRRPSRRRGVALLLTLAVLALLTAMMVSFVYSAIRYEQLAEMNENLVRARLRAEGLLQRVHADLAIALNDPEDRRGLFPATSADMAGQFGPTTLSAAWDGRAYWSATDSDILGNTDTVLLAEALHVELADVDLTPDATNALPADIGWTHLHDAEGSGGIAARVAYLVIDESGKIDPSEAIGTQAEGAERRVGASADDLDLSAALGGAGLAESLQRVGIGNGQLSAGARWFSYYYLFKNNTAAAANATEIVQELTPITYDVEAFRIGTEDYHRYNLAHSDWNSYANTVSAAGITNAATVFRQSRTIAESTGGISWLALAADATQRDQIAANIIDYSDSDSIATADSQDAPTYVGLEKVPYINELVFDLRLTPDGDGTYSLDIIVWPELVNIYSQAAGSGARLDCTVTVNAGGFNATAPFAWTNLTAVAANSYAAFLSETVAVDALANPLLADLSLTVTAKLTDGRGNLWDFAAAGTSTTVTIEEANSPQMTFVEVNDPRHNTPSDQWTWNSWGAATTGTIGARNNACTAPAAGADNDDETGSYMGDGPGGATDTVTLSTAVIRNAPMECLWELGAIHRGKPWQTLNLATHNANANDTTGVGTYAAGDANILDQVKLTPGVEVAGKLNINTTSRDVLKALLVGVRTGATYTTAGTAGTRLTDANAVAILGDPSALVDGKWLFENGSDPRSCEDPAYGDAPFTSRAAIATIPALSDGSVVTQDTDAAQEEIIGKIAPLCTVRANLFTVIGVAQIIRDMPPAIGGTQGAFDLGIDRVLAEQKILATIHRDAFTNQFSMLRFQYLND